MEPIPQNQRRRLAFIRKLEAEVLTLMRPEEM
jgi:hypothetical protein